MLSVYTRAQIAIAVLHDLSSSKVLQPVKFLLQNEEWKDLLKISWKKYNSSAFYQTKKQESFSHMNLVAHYCKYPY